MLRYLFGLLAALFLSLPVHAAFPAQQVWYYGMPGAGGSHSSISAWGAAYAAPRNLTFGGCDPFVSSNNTWCHFTNISNGNPVPVQMQRYPGGLGCPPNAALSGSECTCNSGYLEEGNACVVEPMCEVGKARTVNVTSGWARSSTPNANDLAIDYGAPVLHDYNDGTCVGNIATVDACWRSQEPHTNGLYRVSCDFTMVMTGDAMSSGDANADPMTSEPSCPGFLGEINGKPACVGTASSPLPSLPSPTPSPNPGNPTAGEKPSSGEGSGSTGSGRTPSAGGGGNTGGPGGAASRPGWVNRSPGEDTGQPCGGPGQPVCAVKVDETGVPAEGTAEGRFTQAGSDIDTVKTDAQGAFDDHKNIALPSWTWTFQFPTGCTPLSLGAYGDLSIDVCQWQPIIHDLMSLLWIGAGIWGLIALFRNATGV